MESKSTLETKWYSVLGNSGRPFPPVKQFTVMSHRHATACCKREEKPLRTAWALESGCMFKGSQRQMWRRINRHSWLFGKMLQDCSSSNNKKQQLFLAEEHVVGGDFCSTLADARIANAFELL